MELPFSAHSELNVGHRLVTWGLSVTAKLLGTWEDTVNSQHLRATVLLRDLKTQWVSSHVSEEQGVLKRRENSNLIISNFLFFF